jgi:hypothetical protein
MRRDPKSSYRNRVSREATSPAVHRDVHGHPTLAMSRHCRLLKLRGPLRFQCPWQSGTARPVALAPARGSVNRRAATERRRCAHRPLEVPSLSVSGRLVGPPPARVRHIMAHIDHAHAPWPFRSLESARHRRGCHCPDLRMTHVAPAAGVHTGQAHVNQDSDWNRACRLLSMKGPVRPHTSA